jgi:3-oxoacyl-[acyl-carrier-protein] synthase-3
MGVLITGIGAALPPKLITNDDLAKVIDSSDEWIRSRTGIKTRYAVTHGIKTSDLAYQACKVALRMSSTLQPDMLILATTTPDRLTPATAPKIAHLLGLAGISAFDINAVCTGFIYAVQQAVAALESRLAKKVIVVGADAFTTILNKSDRSTLTLFGDGAGAMVLEYSEETNCLIDVTTGSDGSLEELITIRNGGVESKVSNLNDSVEDNFFSMEGKEVFIKAVQKMSSSVEEILKRNHMTTTDVSFIIPHQANLRIINTIAENIGIAPEKAIISLDKFGNTSAASIPLAIADACQKGVIGHGDNLVITAFGGGVTWGSAILSWPKINSDSFIKFMNGDES